MTGAIGMPSRRPTSTASSDSTSAGTPLRKVSTSCTTSLRPRTMGVSAVMKLSQGPIRAQAAIGADEKDIRPRLDVRLHARFTAEAMHTLHPAALDGRNE